MRLIRSKNYRRMPWKNGGGETIEIAISPPGASIDSFDWRISMARVDGDGPFSLFPGVDRTLAILDGNGIDLEVDAAPPVRVTDQPHAFTGDVKAVSELVDGPVVDLNVMTRRDFFSHRVTPISAIGTTDFVIRSPTALIYCHRGAVSIQDEYAAPFDMHEGDSLLIEAQPNSLRLHADQPAHVYLVEIGPA